MAEYDPDQIIARHMPISGAGSACAGCYPSVFPYPCAAVLGAEEVKRNRETIDALNQEMGQVRTERDAMWAASPGFTERSKAHARGLAETLADVPPKDAAPFDISWEQEERVEVNRLCESFLDGEGWIYSSGTRPVKRRITHVILAPEHQQCDSTCIQRDDRWGGFRNRCELEAGHELPHRFTLDACEPEALMTWVGSSVTEEDG